MFCPGFIKHQNLQNILQRPLSRNEDFMETASNTAATVATKTQSLPTPLYWLALGAFAVGTEGFMIAPLLPGLATDLKVSIETAGQLVTVFALAYGLSSPILTALTG